ncbi:MAG: BREX system P-loop protein BrxC, partial [Chloroflexi bacterium]|nr:BREX system P-loop protein BrxC [Chloroflexota bacterium]
MSAITVRNTIERDLADEPQSVVRVYETRKLRTDLLEYVLTDQLARDLSRVLERVIDAAQPAGGGTEKIGIWVSGFFGSGKSHFAKLAGHLLADTRIGSDSARSLFARLLHAGRRDDEHIRELFQQAATYKLSCHLVLFDITALHSAAADRNVGLTFLRAFYDSLGLSGVIAFAERELELHAAGRYEAFLRLYEDKTGVPWDEDKDLTIASPRFAECLAELLPNRFPTTDLAHRSLDLALQDVANLNIDGVVDKLLQWLKQRQKQGDDKAVQRLVFVADEVGAWAGRNRDRIEQVRSLVETIANKADGRIWLIATSQEKLSAVVQNAPIADEREARDLLQRLEARFQTNVHLESSEVGTVIEDRVLRKKPTIRPALEALWTASQQQLRDVAESPGLELGANYPRADRDAFVRDYPFLPYQIQAAADIFGSMRGVKVSSGARSMIRVVFDATRELADRQLGAVVSWDQIFDSANRDNEFADEQYLGSQGLTYIATADRDVAGTRIRPSRLLKALWLVQQSPRIPRTPANLARLHVGDLDADVLQMEQDVAATLAALAERSYVRQEVATGQWRFLTQDEVTVEKIVQRIGEDIRQKEIRDAVLSLYSKQLLALFNGRITAGKSNTSFEYGVYLNDTPLKNDAAPVQLRVALAGTPAAQHAADESAVNLEEPVAYWVVEMASRLEERLRRAIAIERLKEDEEYRRVATERMKVEADKLELEAGGLRRGAEEDVERAFQGGSLYYAGNAIVLPTPTNGARAGRGSQTAIARPRVEDALRDRINARYHRFAEGDRQLNPANVDKLFTAPAGERANLDPGLALFGPEGHVHGNNVLVEELTNYLRSSTRTAGQDVVESFAGVPFGWPPDLVRYVAAAMFVDGKVSAIDRAGKRHDDPRAPGARSLFGTAAFKTTRLEVEEEALTPAESNQARGLLTDLGQTPADGGEVALKEATLHVCNSLTRRLAVLDRARGVDLPLPASYETIGATLEAISGSGSRVKIVRALLARGQDLRDAVAALKRLEEFDRHNGFGQYGRSQQLLAAALQAGLADDPAWGERVQTARDQIQALKDQRRVLDDWSGACQKYRLEVLDAFRAVYEPLRKELHRRSAEAAQAVTGMPEYRALSYSNAAMVRVEFLGEGKPLHEVSLPELRDEQQLLDANDEYSIAHLRAALAA